MPKQFLHGTEVGTAVEKMSRKCVTQRVRVGWGWGSAVEKSTDIARTEAGAFAIKKHRVGRRCGRGHYSPTMTQPLFKCFDSRSTEGNDSLL